MNVIQIGYFEIITLQNSFQLSCSFKVDDVLSESCNGSLFRLVFFIFHGGFNPNKRTHKRTSPEAPVDYSVNHES